MKLLLVFFSDLAEAFNSTSHQLYIEKFANNEFGTAYKTMLKSFLSNRKNCVKNGSIFSDWTTIMQQGTVLTTTIMQEGTVLMEQSSRHFFCTLY